MSLRKGDEVIAVDDRRRRRRPARRDRERLRQADAASRDYPRKGRGGLGVKTVQLTEAKGQLAGARVVRDGYQVMLISTGGTVIQMPVDDIKRLGRSTQGVIVMRLREGEQVSALAPGRRGGRRPERRPRRPEAAAEPRRRAETPQFRRFSADPFTNSQRERYIFAPRGRSPSPEERSVWPSSRQVDLLEPIDLAEHLDKVELYLGQVCQIAGISKMQLDYWTNKAQIPTQGQEAADLRHRRARDRDADQAGEGQGPEPRRGDRGGAPLPRARARHDGSQPRLALGLAQPRRGLLGRQRVDVDPGAELEPGEDGQARDELEVPVPAARGARRSAGRALRRSRSRRIASASSERGAEQQVARRAARRRARRGAISSS